ncbi:hypothetical protein [Faecalimicrobium sp. JNUCC 81]
MKLKLKAIVLTMVSLTSLGLMVGCSSEKSSTNSKETVTKTQEEKSPVLVKDIEFIESKILEPDSIGARYFQTKFKNNSNKIITSISVEIELDNGEVAYLSSHDSLKPGDTSSIVECFASTTGNLEDMKAKKISITAINDDKQLFIDYDIKLDKYDILESDEKSTVKSPVLVKDIEIVNPTILDPDSIGTRYFKAQIKNNSKLPVTSFSIELELDNGEVAYLSSNDTLLQGDTSSNIECFAPTTGNLEDMKAKTISIVALNENKKEVYINYDVKLNKYDVLESSE